jgi:hypothetical protein
VSKPDRKVPCVLAFAHPAVFLLPLFSVIGLINDTHSAATELLEDAIMRDGLANHDWNSRSGGACRGSFSGSLEHFKNEKAQTSEYIKQAGVILKTPGKS